MRISHVNKIKWLSWGNDFVFSTLLGILVVSAHENRHGFLGWSVRFRNLYGSHPLGDRKMDESYSVYVGAFLLIWTLVSLIFVTTRLMRRFDNINYALLVLSGFVAIAGYPIASLYAHDVETPFMIVELIAAVGYFTLWAARKWPASKQLNSLLLVIHFSLWAWLSSFPYLCCLYIWPGWVWGWGNNIGASMRLVYPLLSLCSALLCTVSVAHRDKTCVQDEQETV